jgi:HPt (histidine-containing phosphotransfer) domain-containing protein
MAAKDFGLSISPSRADDSTAAATAPPAGQGPSAGAALDPEILADLRGVMGDDFADLVQTYLTTVTEMLEALVAAQGCGDMKEMERCAHSIKSSSRHLGALRLGAVAEDLEERIHGRRLEGAQRRLSELRTELDRVRAALEWDLRQPG